MDYNSTHRQRRISKHNVVAKDAKQKWLHTVDSEVYTVRKKKKIRLYDLGMDMLLVTP